MNLLTKWEWGQNSSKFCQRSLWISLYKGIYELFHNFKGPLLMQSRFFKCCLYIITSLIKSSPQNSWEYSNFNKLTYISQLSTRWLSKIYRSLLLILIEATGKFCWTTVYLKGSIYERLNSIVKVIINIELGVCTFIATNNR